MSIFALNFMRLNGRLKNAALLIATAVFLPFLWLGLFSGPDFALEEAYEKRLAELRDRVQYAESLNHERETDVQHLRQQLGVLMAAQLQGNRSELPNLQSNGANMTFSKDLLDLLANHSYESRDIQPPSMFNYLPHLIGKPEGLQPALKMSRGRFGVSIVMGIPTIKRSRDSYLLTTLESLLAGLEKDERHDCLIVVFVGEPDDVEYVRQVADEVKEKFPEAVNEGIIEVISPPAMFYPNMNQLRETFGDSIERVRWRTKQILDFSFLMLYAKSRGTYYLQLEDDVVTKNGYLATMKNFVLNQKTDDWVLLEFSYLGFIGKLFKSSDLPRLVEFFLMFHRDKPIDWLLDHFLYVKVCDPEKDTANCEQWQRDIRIRHHPSLFQHIGTFSSLDGKVQKAKKHCRRSIGELRLRFKPSLFQHVGVHSSLPGKVQKLKDKDFGRQQLHRAHFNPNAQVETTLTIYQHYSIERAYMGETYFWCMVPSADDVITFTFDPPIMIDKYVFKSGNVEHPGDRFYDTTIEVLPVKQPSDEVLAKYPASSNTSFLVIGEFDHAVGIAEGTVDPELGEIGTLRIHVLKTSQSWVILNEIYIKPAQLKR